MILLSFLLLMVGELTLLLRIEESTEDFIG